MYLSKHDQGISKFTIQKGINTHQMNSVLIHDKRLVATDSFRLVEVTNKEEDVEAAESPMLVPGALLKSVKLKTHDRLNVEPAMLAGPDGRIVGDIQQANQFPKYEQIFPERFASEVMLNADFLAEIAKFIGAYGANVKLSVPRERDKPVVLSAETKARSIRVMLMPIAS
jgi:hypothetical protein